MQKVLNKVWVMKTALSVLTLVILVQADVDQSDLIHKQKNLDEKLEKQLSTLQNQINHLDWYFKVGYFNEGDNMMMDDVEEFISNPINTYTMIKRLTLYWPQLRDHLFNQTLIDEWDVLLDDIKSFSGLISQEK